MRAKHLHEIVNSVALRPSIVTKLSEGAQRAALCLHEEAEVFFSRRVSDEDRVPESIIQHYNEFSRQLPKGLKKLLPQNMPTPAPEV